MKFWKSEWNQAGGKAAVVRTTEYVVGVYSVERGTEFRDTIGKRIKEECISVNHRLRMVLYIRSDRDSGNSPPPFQTFSSMQTVYLRSPL